MKLPFTDSGSYLAGNGNNLSNMFQRLSLRVWNYSTMSQPYTTEEQVAITAVRRACHLASSVFNTLVKGETIIKDDTSPVTSSSYCFTLTLRA